MTSLRNRAVAGGVLWAIVVTLAGTYAVGSFLENLTLSRFDELLTARHTQAVVALANSNGDHEEMPRQLADPVYQRPFSGNYWQAESKDGRIVVSRSMADTLLPVEAVDQREAGITNLAGPANQTLRAFSQQVALEDGSTWVVTVASSTASIESDKLELQRRLNISFALAGVLATAGALLIVLFTLRPLSQLRKDVTARKDHQSELSVDEYPQEVQPLVVDINQLLERNREIIGRSRRQTADLAHALKTPSAIMRNELFELQQNGTNVGTAIESLNRLDAQLSRSFARMKASQDSALEQASISLDISLQRIGRAFVALAKNRDRELVLNIATGLHAKINQNDLEEVLGNLLDNALKWSTKSIGLSAMAIGSWIQIVVEDDGPGIPEGGEERALISGQRLDESKPGTGLGLAIASDLVVAYGGDIRIAQSQNMGGAKVIVLLRHTARVDG